MDKTDIQQQQQQQQSVKMPKTKEGIFCFKCEKLIFGKFSKHMRQEHQASTETVQKSAFYYKALKKEEHMEEKKEFKFKCCFCCKEAKDIYHHMRQHHKGDRPQ